MIVLGIDPGRVSGWAIAIDAETIDAHGTARKAEERAAAVVRAKGIADHHGCKLVVCMEWVSAGGGGTRTAMGIGQARGRWLESLEQTIGYSESRVMRATPDQWRRATHGVVRSRAGKRQDREREYKAAAMAYSGIEDENASEAACIALHGMRAMEERVD